MHINVDVLQWLSHYNNIVGMIKLLQVQYVACKCVWSICTVGISALCWCLYTDTSNTHYYINFVLACQISTNHIKSSHDGISNSIIILYQDLECAYKSSFN